MNFNKIKQEISIISYLKSIGYRPYFENGYTARFIAKYRSDSNPSLSINKSSNLWYDHGIGVGGNIIQLVALILNCSDYESAKILTEQKDSFSFHCKPIQKQSSSIKINKVKILENKALLQYLGSRCINLDIAKQYCREAYYTVNDKQYFATAFENKSGGYELRSKYFKGCTSKDVSIIYKGSETLSIFEGFMDFLSYFTVAGLISEDIIILNSISNINKLNFLDAYSKINLYLDNDQAGSGATCQLLQTYKQTIDCRSMYNDFKDFNDFLMNRNSNIRDKSILMTSVLK